MLYVVVVEIDGDGMNDNEAIAMKAERGTRFSWWQELELVARG